MKKTILALLITAAFVGCNDDKVVNGPPSNDDVPSETTTSPDGTTTGGVISRDTSAMSVEVIDSVNHN